MSATRFSTLRTRSAALAAALAITASACGGSDSTSTTTAATDTSTASSDAMTDDTMSDDTMADDTMADDTMADDTMADDTMADSTEAPGSDTTAAHSGDSMIDGSTLWTSPDGKISMEIDPTWTDAGAAGAMAGMWTIGTSGANVTVVDVPGIDVSLQEFIDTSVSQLPQVGTFTVIDSGVKKGPHGNDIGYLEYSGEASAAAGVEVHIMQTITVANGHAALATFSTVEADYAASSASVVPYIETIQAL